ncbi:UrcA family protein [Asticcacaulis machinosus]|uniref:UrcA family protein n=1 Tax=Asticcacaulis machinosus TaxID=2984211 RepID=A0ABT5HIP7_9CAUL|nr:UrcA family protein [Asticcacaulis machinosus]MDC7675474.1 UrcA family protein [Asticcacaulis machinosus]
MVRSVFMAALMSLAVLGAGATAAQAEGREATKTVVSVEGVDFNKSGQVAKVYRKLKKAAYAQCDSGYKSSSAQDSLCAKAALSSAVSELNQPTLTALHEAKTGTAQSVYADNTKAKGVSQ